MLGILVTGLNKFKSTTYLNKSTKYALRRICSLKVLLGGFIYYTYCGFRDNPYKLKGNYQSFTACEMEFS